MLPSYEFNFNRKAGMINLIAPLYDRKKVGIKI